MAGEVKEQFTDPLRREQSRYGTKACMFGPHWVWAAIAGGHSSGVTLPRHGQRTEWTWRSGTSTRACRCEDAEDGDALRQAGGGPALLHRLAAVAERNDGASRSKNCSAVATSAVKRSGPAHRRTRPVSGCTSGPSGRHRDIAALPAGIHATPSTSGSRM